MIADIIVRMKWVKITLTLSWRRPLWYRNQYIDLLCKSMDWFLYDDGLRHERVKYNSTTKSVKLALVKLLWFINLTFKKIRYYIWIISVYWKKISTCLIEKDFTMCSYGEIKFHPDKTRQFSALYFLKLVHICLAFLWKHALNCFMC